MKKFFFVWIFFFSTATFAQTSDVNPADALDPTDLFSHIWSPFCHGISLLECPSSKAEDLRREIRARIKAGQTPEAMFKEVNEQYGGTLRMEPSSRGRESLAYWIPWILIVLSIFTVLFFWRSKRKQFRGHADAKHSAADDSKILEDLKSRL